MAKELLSEDPESGALFVFVNKRATRIKVLWFDRNGYCILYKRLHGARFELPEPASGSRPVAMVNARALAWMLRGVEKK